MSSVSGIRCFMLESAGKSQRYLRRYSSGSNNCTGAMSYHDAMISFDVVEERLSKDGTYLEDIGGLPAPEKDSPQWPKKCSCGYEFIDKDQWNIFSSSIYRRSDTGEEMTLRDAPDGAIWDAVWLHDWKAMCGPDGRSLVCKVPKDHEWQIDGPCNNCPWRNDPSKSEHKCWVRHGEPPNLTVDKEGFTCPVGAGSVQTGTWHGYLTNGVLDVTR